VTSENRYKKKEKGTYRATMWVPGNLLSEGLISISVAFFEPNPFELFIFLEKIISINIVDEMKGNSARGLYSHDFPGFVRPLLLWETNKIK
jgi:lipopolysaccharide transport system ATP-binding protein